MALKDFFNKLLGQNRGNRLVDNKELYEKLMKSGAIHEEGYKEKCIQKSVLEISDGLDVNNEYFSFSKSFGEAIIKSDFSIVSRLLDDNVSLVLYDYNEINGKSDVLEYWNKWIEKYNEPNVGTRYEVKICKWFDRIALEIIPRDAKKMYLVARFNQGKVTHILSCPNPLQNSMIRYWDLDRPALSFSNCGALYHKLGKDLEPQCNRMPCMRCGRKSEDLQWYQFTLDRGPLVYDGELTICPDCMDVVEYYPTIMYRVE